jgi:hypothetical protein
MEHSPAVKHRNKRSSRQQRSTAHAVATRKISRFFDAATFRPEKRMPPSRGIEEIAITIPGPTA